MLIFWGIVNEVNARSLCEFFKAFLGKVNEVNALSHYTQMNHPICWDYQRTITMLIFSDFLGKSIKSTHDPYDQFFMFFYICPSNVPIILYKVNEVNAISHSILMRIILNCDAISAQSLCWFLIFFRMCPTTLSFIW